MKFWNREKEKKWLKHYLLAEPNAILFVYGPRSSGKTTLLMKVVEEFPKEKFVYYWFDLRGKLISSYKDVIDMFFVDEESYRELEEVSKKIEGGIMSFFKVSVESKKKIGQKKIDAFEYMERILEKHALEKRTPVIVFDEIQKLKEVYLNDGKQRPFIKELFNFFVRITKVLHLAHVIVMSSDTFFIEQIYIDSTLKNTSEFYLVDYFNDDTAEKILISEGFSERDASFIVKFVGGVPWMLERVLLNEDFKDTIHRLYLQSKSRLLSYIEEKIENGEDIRVLKEILKEIPFKEMFRGEFLKSGEKLREIKRLVEREILFYDPLSRIIRFQTKLDEKAAEELLKSI